MKKYVLLLISFLFSSIVFAANEADKKTQDPNITQKTEKKVDPQQVILQAYQKEFIFLNSEKKSLLTQIETMKHEMKAEDAKLELEIDEVQSKVLALTTQNEKSEAKISAAEEQLGNKIDSGETVANILLQGNESLKSYQSIGMDGINEAKDLNSLFNLTQKILDQINLQRIVTKEYFDKDGNMAQGEVVHYGASMAFLKNGDEYIALAPAGFGKLRVWKDKQDHIHSFHKSTKSEILQGFLFEGMEKEIISEKEKTVAQIFHGGGLIGWIITFFGVLTVIFILMRAAILQRAANSSSGMMAHVESSVKAGNLSEAIKIAESTSSSVSRVVAYTLKQLHKTREQIEDSVSEIVLKETLKLDRFSTLIMVTAAIAPLLGLLGTVTGMIATFDIITDIGTGDPKMLSGGISEALITTMFGLIVAIPCLFFGHILSGWSERIKGKIEHAALIVINAYEKSVKALS